MCTDIVSVRVVCFSLYEDFSDVDGCVVGWIIRLLFLIVHSRQRHRLVVDFTGLYKFVIKLYKKFCPFWEFGASIPEVVGSIPTVVGQNFQPTRRGFLS